MTHRVQPCLIGWTNTYLSNVYAIAGSSMIATFCLCVTDDTNIGYGVLFILWGILLIRNIEVWCCETEAEKPDLKSTFRESKALKQSMMLRDSKVADMGITPPRQSSTFVNDDDDDDDGDLRDTDTVLDDLHEAEQAFEDLSAKGTQIFGGLMHSMRHSSVGASVNSDVSTADIELTNVGGSATGASSLKGYMEGHESLDEEMKKDDPGEEDEDVDI